MSTTTFDPVLTETSEILGEQAGETIDELVRDALNQGTTVLYANSKTQRTNLLSTDIITVTDVRKIALQMELFLRGVKRIW